MNHIVVRIVDGPRDGERVSVPADLYARSHPVVIPEMTGVDSVSIEPPDTANRGRPTGYYRPTTIDGERVLIRYSDGPWGV